MNPDLIHLFGKTEELTQKGFPNKKISGVTTLNLLPNFTEILFYYFLPDKILGDFSFNNFLLS